MSVMSIKIVLIILFILMALCSSMFVSVICIKLAQARREKKRSAYIKKIKPVLTGLFAAEPIHFFKNYKRGISKLGLPMENKFSLQVLEDLLLEIIENGKIEKRIRARTIADQLGLPPKSLNMIHSRLENNIAIGCRKAGLYQYEGAIPDIVKALDIFSSATQFEVLMALSRIGNISVMVQAFDKIHKFILINERAINEIVNVYSGDRYELFHKMLYHQSDYLARIFLKAIDRDTANALINDILIISKTGGKETRLACIIAIGRSGNSRKIPVLTRAMRDPEWEIRAMAAKTLGILTGPSAIAPLAKAARDNEWWVRQNAISSILAYPGYEMILSSIIKSGDKYAYDSILYTLEKTKQTGLLSGISKVSISKPSISKVWSKEPKKATLSEEAANQG